MTTIRVRALAPIAALAIAVSFGAVAPAAASPTSTTSASATRYSTCAELNKKYKHGVGKKGAHDKVRGSTKPVTNFYVSTTVYNANKSRDRDKDGVACEKR